MKTASIVSITFFVILFACERSGDETTIHPVSKDKITGYVQKGPYNNGTDITISELDENLVQTGLNFSTRIMDNKGTFELTNISLSSQFVELKANGFYYNEVLGENSAAHLTLFALTDLTDSSSINVNVMSSLEKARVEFLMSSGMAFTDAKRQAQQEILNIFNIEQQEIIASEYLDISKSGDNNAILLAVSLILQGYRTVAELSELLANISTDIREDGELNSSSTGSALINHATYLDETSIRNNLEARYNAMGVPGEFPDFEGYIDQFVNNTEFELTSLFLYPEQSDYGTNILSDSISTLVAYQRYSMSASIPDGASLKIRLKLVSTLDSAFGHWSYRVMPNGPINWKVSRYDHSNYSQIFEVIESGETSDLNMSFHADNDTYIGIDYYENTLDTPTRTRTIKVIPATPAK